jgi:hypothetical protein
MTQRGKLIPTRLELLLLVLCASVCAVQLLLPGYIGIANNGDFGKIDARFSCAPPDDSARNFTYFVADYACGPQYYWKSGVVSSEILLAAVPLLAARGMHAAWFNIRWLGALHALLFLAAYYAMLLYLRPQRRAVQAILALLALWILGDVAYIAYFNSFYSDTAAILGLLLMVALGLRLVSLQPPGRMNFWLFAAAALLFIGSKSQHGLWGFLPAALVLAAAWPSRPLRRTGAALCGVLLVAQVWTFAAGPWDYSAQALYNVIFYRIAPHSPDPRATLRTFGLDESYDRFIGTHAFLPGNPTNDPAWLAAFARRTGYGYVLRYYIRHPVRMLAVLASDLREYAPMIRPWNLGNFRRDAGRAPGAQTTRFASWSTLRSTLFRRWPWHIVIWYTLWFSVAVWLLLRGGARRVTVLLALGVGAMAIGEYFVASLADAVETYRHLLLFHLLTDLTVLFAAGWVLSAPWRSYSQCSARTGSMRVARRAGK